MRASMCVSFSLQLSPLGLIQTCQLQGGRVIEFLLQILGNKETDKVQALICTGYLKLMLPGMISNE
jgi:hypothetical protein